MSALDAHDKNKKAPAARKNAQQGRSSPRKFPARREPKRALLYINTRRYVKRGVCGHLGAPG
jgi:hypothetical protein